VLIKEVNMVQFLQAKEVTLRDLINHFQLQFIEDEHFFGEWQQDLELEFRLKNQTVKSSLIIRTHKKKT
jgi:hypothetical protein